MIKLEFYAALKDYFPKQLILEHHPADISMLKAALINQNPLAKGLLNMCRFAIDDQFVMDNYILKKGQTILVVPPSSGG